MMDEKKSESKHIVLDLDFKKMQEDIAQLRVEISMLMLERDEIVHHQNPNIEAAYILELGVLEYRLYELECNILRAQRKMQLMQVYINRQEHPDMKAVEHVLTREFEEYEKKIQEHLAQINKALDRSSGTLLSESETKELKSLYRNIVKLLHPDLHPELSPELQELFVKAVEAYKNGDLAELRIIECVIDGREQRDLSASPVDTLNKERERLEKLVQKLAERIENLKNEYPYILHEFLDNPEKMAERKKMLEESIATAQEFLQECHERAAEMWRVEV